MAHPHPKSRRVELPGEWPGTITMTPDGRLRIYLGRGHGAANSAGWTWLGRFLAWASTGVRLPTEIHVHHMDNDHLNIREENRMHLHRSEHSRLHAATRTRNEKGQFAVEEAE